MMVELRLTVRWVKNKVSDWVSSKLKGIDEQFKKNLDAILNIFLERAKTYAPVVTGALRDSIEVIYYGINDATVMPTAEHSIFVLDDTKPHVIEAVNAKALYWDGALHPVKKVNHPGTTANQFMTLTFMDAISEAEQVSDEILGWLEQ